MSRDEKLEKKVLALSGGEQFKDEVDSSSVESLRQRIFAMQKELEDSETHKENNQKLKDAKEEVKLMSGAYSDVKKAVRIKTKYILALLEEKGAI